jgi:lycopene cyclase domain-containing protein
VERFAYLAVLLGIVLGSAWLEIVLRTNVLRRFRRLLLTLLPVVVVFLVWDAYAIDSGHWTFDPGRVTGLEVVAGIPVEELLFFLVVPFAAILTLEAVRSVRGWDVGDEASGREGQS